MIAGLANQFTSFLKFCKSMSLIYTILIYSVQNSLSLNVEFCHKVLFV